MAREDLTTVSGHAFMVTDRLGDISQDNDRGLIVADTRVLSRYVLRLNGAVPLLLRSGPVDHNSAQVFATNAALGTIPNHTLSLSRHRTLSGTLREEIAIANCGSEPVSIELAFTLDADFADIFEIRSFLTNGRSVQVVARLEDSEIVFSDRTRNWNRQTRIRFSREPDAVQPGHARFRIDLQPHTSWTLEVRVEWLLDYRPSSRAKPRDLSAPALSPFTSETDNVHPGEPALPAPIQSTVQQHQLVDWSRDIPTLQTSDLPLLLAYNRSILDLATLQLPLSNGFSIPAAGVPWYLAIFGRDSIITSLQTLPVAPHFAVGVLRTLAAYQATQDNAFRDAEPGKMPHEIRFGALAQTDAVPHARYYGTVDATPLWLILLASTYDWTGDRSFVEELLPAARNALRWIDDFGDLDGDGLIEYRKRSPLGLDNQGWKDSWDSIQFAGGERAEGAIALVEVQGYVYAAKQAIAGLYETLGREGEAAALRTEAVQLKQRVQDAFWMPAEQCYALALDGRKQQVDSVASNQGHLLWAGLPDPEHAAKVVERLMAPDCFSGWGIRTLANTMVGYNPVSYHNGSVWPHDTAWIAAGFARYGFDREARSLAEGLIDASQLFDGHALPELFCGYDRAETPFPVDYPVACSPQAWSAGATIMLVSMLAGIAPGDRGLRVDPLTGGRDLRLLDVPFRGQRYDIGTRVELVTRTVPDESSAT